MPRYMLLLYRPAEFTEEDARERADELPVWQELWLNLRDAGLLIDSGQLEGTHAATSLRVRDGQTEVSDGPFATTKEILGGYYVLDCRDLDEALGVAARVPLARWGTVEVRPLMETSVAAAA